MGILSPWACAFRVRLAGANLRSKGLKMIQPSDFIKIKHDINGNPRHVCHFLHFSRNYADALAIAKKLGGKKFHNKQYGGGIVFQEYTGCLDNLCERLNALVSAEVTA